MFEHGKHYICAEFILVHLCRFPLFNICAHFVKPKHIKRYSQAFTNSAFKTICIYKSFLIH